MAELPSLPPQVPIDSPMIVSLKVKKTQLEQQLANTELVKAKIEQRMADVIAAIEALESNPEITRILNLVDQARR